MLVDCGFMISKEVELEAESFEKHNTQSRARQEVLDETCEGGGD
jgi:hypothetical protein